MVTEQVQSYLQEIVIPLRLSCTTPSGWPMVLSLWYLYQDGHLYCATQETARVVAYIRHDPRCAFEVAADQPPYCGVRGQAKARLDDALGAVVLEQLLTRYLGGTSNPLAQRLLARSETEVAILIEPVNLFTWNFSERMKESVKVLVEKPCPE
jgi:nitroimidazol reductase NimA-like FMN-containing flavoprotein (pyridoxamine 5'-phosphate oxidase superfamily)